MYLISNYAGILGAIKVAYTELATWLGTRGVAMKFPFSAYEDQFAQVHLPSSEAVPAMANGPNAPVLTVRWNNAERNLVAEAFVFQFLASPFDSFLRLINRAQEEVLPKARQHKVKNRQSLGSDMRLLIGIACSNLRKVVAIFRELYPDPRWSIAHELGHYELKQAAAAAKGAVPDVRTMPWADLLHLAVRRYKDEVEGQGLNPTRLMQALIEAMEADAPKSPPPDGAAEQKEGGATA